MTAPVENGEGDLDVISVPFDGGGPALTALQGRTIDVMPTVPGGALEQIKMCNVEPLAGMDTAAIPVLPEVSPATDRNPEDAGSCL